MESATSFRSISSDISFSCVTICIDLLRTPIDMLATLFLEEINGHGANASDAAISITKAILNLNFKGFPVLIVPILCISSLRILCALLNRKGSRR